MKNTSKTNKTTVSKSLKKKSRPFTFDGMQVLPGEQETVELPIPGAFGRQDISLPVIVTHGKKEGPVLFVSAAVHGDEIGGSEIIRRLLSHSALRKLNGTLLAIPVVNVYGFMHQSRYLPDRRDLNRSFPGLPSGSLASRLAYIFMEQVVKKSTHGIDLHTAAIHRTNLPQIRGYLKNPEVKKMCISFGAPVILDANLRDGSLRDAVRQSDIPVILYEAGEALRLEETAVRAGLQGILGVMGAIGMLRPRKLARAEPVIAQKSYWVRAPQAGLLRGSIKAGTRIARETEIGIIADPAGQSESIIISREGGIVIGKTTNPLLNEGDAVYHIAVFDDSGQTEEVAGNIEDYSEALQDFSELSDLEISE